VKGDSMIDWLYEIAKWTFKLSGFKIVLWNIYIGINIFVSSVAYLFYPLITSAETDSLKKAFKIPIMIFIIQFSLLFLILIIGWQINK
jgi:hypothetical protein